MAMAALNQQSYLIPGPVNAWMHDCLQAVESSCYETNHSRQFSLLPAATR